MSGGGIYSKCTVHSTDDVYPLAGKSTPLQRVVIDSVTTSQGTEPGKQGKYDELHMSTSLVVADSYSFNMPPMPPMPPSQQPW